MHQMGIITLLLNLLEHILTWNILDLNKFRASIIGIKAKLITKNVDLIDKNLDKTNKIDKSIADKIIFFPFEIVNLVIIKSPQSFMELPHVK